MLDDGNDQTDLLEWMLVHIKEARAALDKGDIDRFAQAFERVIQHRIKAGIPSFEEALKSKGQSTAGKGKEGYIGPMKITIGMIVDAIGSAKLSDVLDAIEDEDDRLMEGVFYSGSNPSPITFTGVDHIKKRLAYQIRKTGKKDTITFGALDNNLTNFR